MMFSKRIAYCGSLSALVFSLGAGAMQESQASAIAGQKGQIEDIDPDLMSDQKHVCKIPREELIRTVTTQDLGGTTLRYVRTRIEKLVTTTKTHEMQKTEDWAERNRVKVPVLALKAACPELEWVPVCGESNDQCQLQEGSETEAWKTNTNVEEQILGNIEEVTKEHRKITIHRNTETGQFLYVEEYNEHLPDLLTPAGERVTEEKACKRTRKVSKRSSKSNK